jgi:RHS repeat-associated protein
MTQALTLNHPFGNMGHERSYDVWGGVRSGAATGGPKCRYCANLGHVQDDESGLIYMRARYYEPSTGRFISEDPARDGINWFLYASNSPGLRVDQTGLSDVIASTWTWFALMGTLLFNLGTMGVMARASYATWVMVQAQCLFLIAWVTSPMSDESAGNYRDQGVMGGVLLSCMALRSSTVGMPPLGRHDVASALKAYGSFLVAFLTITELESAYS